MLTNGLVDKIGSVFHGLECRLELTVVGVVFGCVAEKALEEHAVARDPLDGKHQIGLEIEVFAFGSLCCGLEV